MGLCPIPRSKDFLKKSLENLQKLSNEDIRISYPYLKVFEWEIFV